MVPANIFDFHGTLVDVTGVHELLRRRDYDCFYAGSLHCPPIASTVEEARRSRDSGYMNLLFTGMPVRYYDGLYAWIAEHDVPIHFVAMRGDSDRRKAFVVKKEMYLNAVDAGYYVTRAWDDDPAVVDLWKALGVPAVLVPGWVENLTTRRFDKQISTS